MCCGGNTIDHVRLTRCHHGVFHLYLGSQTLHLTLHELVMIGQAINGWVHTHPEVLHEIDTAAWQAMDHKIRFE